MQIGLELLPTTPVQELTIDEVARRAGISRSLLFHYFATKREYYTAVTRAAADLMLEHLLPRADDAARGAGHRHARPLRRLGRDLPRDATWRSSAVRPAATRGWPRSTRTPGTGWSGSRCRPSGCADDALRRQLGAGRGSPSPRTSWASGRRNRRCPPGAARPAPRRPRPARRPLTTAGTRLASRTRYRLTVGMDVPMTWVPRRVHAAHRRAAPAGGRVRRPVRRVAAAVERSAPTHARLRWPARDAGRPGRGSPTRRPSAARSSPSPSRRRRDRGCVGARHRGAGRARRRPGRAVAASRTPPGDGVVTGRHRAAGCAAARSPRPPG